MRSSLIAVTVLAAISSAQFLNQTAPFNLVLLSSNETINGTALGACHEGAAIEGLCTGTSSVGSPFKLNYTDTQTVDPAIGLIGYLIFELPVGGLPNGILSSPMELSTNPISNVAVPLFTPAEYGQQVSIDSEGKLNIPGGLDDTTGLYSGPTYANKNYARWQVCNTYAGYLYNTLAWTFGNGVPENPSCQAVEVVQVFI